MPRPEVFIWFSGASGSATAAVSKPSPSSPTTISRSSVEPPRVSMTRRDGSWRFPCLIAFARASRSATPIQCSASFSMPRTLQTYSSTAWPSSRFSNRLESHSTIGPGETDDSVIAHERGDALLSSTLDGYLHRYPERGRMIRERAAGRPSIPSALALMAVLLAAPGLAAAERPIAERLPEAVAGAQKLVEKVRGVPFPGTVPSAILHEKDLARVLARKLVEDLPAPFPRYAASLAAAGFFDPEPGLEQKITTLYARQVAGFYDPAEKKFFIVPEPVAETAAGAPELGLSAETLLEDTLLAHELTHALQERRLDLVPRLKALRDSSDGL